MKLPNPIRFLTLATVAVSSVFPMMTTQASTFEETDLNQTEVIAVARPYGENKYDLLIIQQIPNKNKCWDESGSNPVIVTPLLLNFDFSGHCNRATDSNGYSIRVDGQDYGLDLLLRLVPKNGELILVGTPRKGGGTEIIVGRTGGLQRDFMKIILEPGWKFSKRSFNGKVLGHFYFSGTQSALNGSNGQTSTPEENTNPENSESMPENPQNPSETLEVTPQTTVEPIQPSSEMVTPPTP